MGVAKPWLPFGDEVLLQRVVRLLAEVVSPVVVVAAAGQDLPVLSEGAIVARDARVGRGPLEGMLAGFSVLDRQAEAAFVASCDAPLLKPVFVSRVIERLGDHAIAAPMTDGYWHPLAAAYRLDVRGVIERMLAADHLRPSDLLRECDTLELSAADFADVDPTLESLRNCNTPEEYEHALRVAGLA